MIKTVGILVSSRFLYPCGIGVFLMSAIDFFKKNKWSIVLILDGKFKNKLKDLDVNDVNVYENNNIIDKKIHQQLFSFEENICFENVLNYRTSLCNSLKENIFDLIICNDLESILCVYNMGLQDYINVFYYTHCHSIIKYSNENNANIDIFSQKYIDFLLNIMNLPGINFITQSQLNNRLLGNRCEVLPILVKNKNYIFNESKEGILFIGRWDERKNISFFFDTIKRIKNQINKELKIKIITKESNIIKFRKKFEELNYKNYDLFYDLNENDKFDVINSSKILFYPSKLEAYCIVIKECIPYIDCLILEEYGWWKMWDGYVEKTNKENCVNDLLKLYNRPINKELFLKRSIELEKKDERCWDDFLKNLKSKNIKQSTNSNFLKTLNMKNEILLKSYFNNLGREPYLSDFINVYKSRNYYDIFLRKSPNNFFDESLTQIFLRKK